MTTCPRGPDFMLTADLSDPEVARHVEACPSCQSEVARISATYTSLDQALSSSPDARPDAAALVRRARLRGSDGWRGGTWRARAGVALLAAAGLAAVLLMPGEEPVPSQASLGSETSGRANIEASSHNFAVLPTRDPDITVVWFYE